MLQHGPNLTGTEKGDKAGGGFQGPSVPWEVGRGLWCTPAPPWPWRAAQRGISQYINLLTRCSLIQSAAHKVKGFQQEI